MQKRRNTKRSSTFMKTVCPLCHKADADFVLYNQNFQPRDITATTFSARRLPDKLHYTMVKCGHDTMVRSTPILAPTQLQKLYAKSTFTYQPEVKNLMHTYAIVLEPVLAKLPKNAAILEIGCGNGFMLEYLHKQGFTNVRGVEPSADAISKASVRVRRRIKKAIFSRALFAPRSFDLIMIFQTLDHIPQPDKFLKDCSTILRPGGKLLSVHHDVESFSAIAMGEKSPIFDVEHTQLFSKKTSMLLMQNAGFTVEAIGSPSSVVSLRHLLWLFPLPKSWKRWILAQKGLSSLLSAMTTTAKLGNIRIVGRKTL